MDYEIEQVKKALSLKMDRELTKEEEAFTEYNHETVIGIMSMFGEKLKQIEDLLESQRDRVRFVKMRWKAVDNQRKAYYKMLEKAVPNYFTKTLTILTPRSNFTVVKRYFLVLNEIRMRNDLLPKSIHIFVEEI